MRKNMQQNRIEIQYSAETESKNSRRGIFGKVFMEQDKREQRGCRIYQYNTQTKKYTGIANTSVFHLIKNKKAEYTLFADVPAS